MQPDDNPQFFAAPEGLCIEKAQLCETYLWKRQIVRDKQYCEVNMHIPYTNL